MPNLGPLDDESPAELDDKAEVDRRRDAAHAAEDWRELAPRAARDLLDATPAPTRNRRRNIRPRE